MDTRTTITRQDIESMLTRVEMRVEADHKKWRDANDVLDLAINRLQTDAAVLKATLERATFELTEVRRKVFGAS